LSRVSFFLLLFGILSLTYLVVASLIAFFTVKIVGIPIGPRMFSKIVLTIILFIPLYLAIAFLISRFVSRDLTLLERDLSDLHRGIKYRESRIREIDRLSKALSDQARKISQIIEAQRLMLYRIAHDLRTPVSNIRNVLGAIKEGVIGSREREAYLDRVINETAKIERTLENALSKLRKISRENRREVINLREFLEGLRDLWSIKARERGMILTLEVTDNLRVLASKEDMEEILSNLIDNALRHSGGSEVWIRAFPEGERVRIVVEDNGKGMGGERLMDSYKKGSLGLYLVRELVWRSGGEVRFEGGDRGTKVVIDLPSV
jgi:signal transduction histidine kinase